MERIYVEENYLGAALLSPSPIGPYLSKFAVERTAQGEGIGGDLWKVITRDYASVFWRARPDNPITPWYAKQCDGLHRFPEWHVFWKGLPAGPGAGRLARVLEGPGARRVEAAIAFARSLPPDFVPQSPVAS